jgi:hypothetical protein
MSGSHVAPSRSTGKQLVYALRGVPKSARANLAVNGVPELCPPYTDGQLTALFHVSRADLKRARQRAQAPDPTLEEIIRQHGTDATWDALLSVMDES